MLAQSENFQVYLLPKYLDVWNVFKYGLVAFFHIPRLRFLHRNVVVERFQSGDEWVLPLAILLKTLPRPNHNLVVGIELLQTCHFRQSVRADAQRATRNSDVGLKQPEENVLLEGEVGVERGVDGGRRGEFEINSHK